LHKFGPQILKNILKFTINDFEYLISRGKLQFAGNINGAAEFMFPYLDALDSEVDRSDSITRIADIYKIERTAVVKDYSNRKPEGFAKRQVNVLPKLQIRRNAELSLLTMIAVNMELYPEFRAALEIKEIDDRAAKEIFIALEECFKHDESGIDSLLARINDEELRNYVAGCGTSQEFKGEPYRFMKDGINKIRKKRLEKRLTEINAQMRENERQDAGMVNIDELLAEKKIIDSQIRKLEGR
jgi:DNA primase